MHFENRFYTRDEMLVEYVHKILCGRLKKMGIAAILLGIIWLGIGFTNHNELICVVSGLCLWIIICTLFLTPRITIKRMQQYNQHLHNGKNCETVVQFDEHIKFQEGSMTLEVAYSQIVKVYHLKHAYVLMIGKQNGIILEPNSFTVGDFESFQHFIQEKCPHINL